jgi:hypothetical protein
MVYKEVNMAGVRNIKAEVERLLWGIAAGRCEFEGCNKVLYRHEVTGASENLAQKAHIHAVSPGGARFLPDDEEFKNDANNLMLVCPQCHIIIDRNEQLYIPEKLYKMKEKHEKRIYTLTCIGAELHSHMLYYTAPIAGTHLSVNDGDARNALANIGRYPSDSSPIIIGQQGNLIEDNEEDFYKNNAENLRRYLKSRVYDVIAKGDSVALFALAPQPMLMLLGYMLNDKYNVTVFQCHRRETDKWRWNGSKDHVAIRLVSPPDTSASVPIALVFALSSTVSHDRITSILGDDVAIYTVTLDTPNRLFVTNPGILDDFIAKSREMIDDIKQRHGKDKEINVFPAMPASLAIRFGMDYMPKADNRLNIYDELPERGFVYALSIGGTYEQ